MIRLLYGLYRVYSAQTRIISGIAASFRSDHPNVDTPGAEYDQGPKSQNYSVHGNSRKVSSGDRPYVILSE